MAMNRDEFIRRMIYERKMLQPAIGDADPVLAVLISNGLYKWAGELADEIFGPALSYEIGLTRWKGDKIIHAIKTLREVSGRMGLKEAKDAVEDMRDAPLKDRLVIGVYTDYNSALTVMNMLAEAGFDGGIRSIG